MRPSTDSLKVGADRPSQDLILTGGLSGLRVTETQTFHADTYTIDKRIRVENTGASPREITVALPWSTRQDWRDEKTKEKFQGQHPTDIVWSTGGSVAHADNLCTMHAVTTDGSWIGMGSVWYMTALVPHGDGFKLSARSDVVNQLEHCCSLVTRTSLSRQHGHAGRQIA